MIVCNVKLHGFYDFKEFEICFTHLRTAKITLVENEFLAFRKTFRYNKLSVLTGASSTGKTALGLAIKNICAFLSDGNKEHLYKMLSEDNASFEIDLINDGKNLERYSGSVSGDEVTVYKDTAFVGRSESYEITSRKLTAPVLMKQFESDFCIYTGEEQLDGELNLNCLDGVLKAIDPTIDKVEMVGNEVFLYRAGKKLTYLPQSIKDGFKIAHLLATMKDGKDRFYYIDDLCINLKSEIELAVLEKIAALITDDAQVVYASKNSDALLIGMPKHTFIFIGKEKTDNGYRNFSIAGPERIPRTTDSVYVAEKNNLFASLTDTASIKAI